MARQYVTVKFRPNDKRSYTYHNDGDPVKEGDLVKIPGKTEADGWTALKVVYVQPEGFKPPFATKAILGLAPPKEEDKPSSLFDARGGSPHGDPAAQ